MNLWAVSRRYQWTLSALPGSSCLMPKLKCFAWKFKSSRIFFDFWKSNEKLVKNNFKRTKHGSAVIALNVLLCGVHHEVHQSAAVKPTWEVTTLFWWIISSNQCRARENSRLGLTAREKFRRSLGSPNSAFNFFLLQSASIAVNAQV